MDTNLSMHLALNKYKNNKDLSTAIKMLITPAINFYGEKFIPLIIETLKAVKIVTTEGNNSVYYTANMLTGYQVISNTSMYTAGLHIDLPYVGYKQGNFYMSSFKRFIVIDGKIDLLSEKGLSTLCHELFAHGVCGTINPFLITGNSLITRSGLYKTIQEFHYDKEMNKIIPLSYIAKGSAINEGFTTYIEEQILKQIITDYISRGYPMPKEVAKVLCEKSKFGKIVIDAMLYGKDIDLAAIYSNSKQSHLTDWEELCVDLDEIVKMNDIMPHLNFELDFMKTSGNIQGKISKNLMTHLGI